jgi:hypothetical protein
MSDCVMKCSNCAYFRAVEEEGGNCHRYPPIWITTPEGCGSDFPTVAEDDFCGEFVRGGN